MSYWIMVDTQDASDEIVQEWLALHGRTAKPHKIFDLRKFEYETRNVHVASRYYFRDRDFAMMFRMTFGASGSLSKIRNRLQEIEVSRFS